MADDITIAYGVGTENDDRADSFYELDQRESEDKLNVKVEALEQEKLSLINENEGMKAQVLQYKAKIESLESEDSKLKLKLGELERESQESKKALDAIAPRAQQLEIEVERLRDDLNLAMIAGQESNSEISEMKKLLVELRKEKLEEENKVRDLESKIGAFEVEERSNKLKMEESMREKLDEKEKEISEYKKKLQSSEEMLREMEEKIVEMQKKVVEAEISIDGLKERSMEAVNGIEGQGIDKETKGFKVDTPLLALGLSAAVLATAAVVCVHYARRA